MHSLKDQKIRMGDPSAQGYPWWEHHFGTVYTKRPQAQHLWWNVRCIQGFCLLICQSGYCYRDSLIAVISCWWIGKIVWLQALRLVNLFTFRVIDVVSFFIVRLGLSMSWTLADIPIKIYYQNWWLLQLITRFGKFIMTKMISIYHRLVFRLRPVKLLLNL